MTKPEFMLRPLIELTLAAALWGFGFVATVWAQESLSTPAIMFYRFSIAFTCGILILSFRRKNFHQHFAELKLSFWVGVFLFITLLLQTYGLQWTTATKSAFITTLYVILVPVIGQFFLRDPIPKIHWLWVFVAVIGTMMIFNFQWQDLSIGDGLTFLCSIAAAIHIIITGKFAHQSKDHFMFNTYQSFWCAFFSIPFYFFSDKWSLSVVSNNAWIGLMSLAIGSSLIGFYLQIRAQKHIKPALASLLFLLESPFSYLFAFFLLSERLNAFQMAGAGLILLACTAASFTEKKEVTK